MNFYVIPGNHDPFLDSKSIPAKNVTVFTQPTVHQLDDSKVHFCFIPYQNEKLMNEALQTIESFPEKWVLIGHADWQSSVKTTNPFEPGVYMPLSRNDIQVFHPMQIFLGHIHKPMDDGTVHYPGSPCGLDITETGKRRFLIFDTANGSTQEFSVDTDIIYFSETMLILPLENEADYIHSRLSTMKKSWEGTVKDKEKIRLRLKIKGYSSDLKQLNEIIEEELKDYQFYNKESVDLREVYISDDFELQEIATQAAQAVKDISWNGRMDRVTSEDILFQALKVIYGG